MWTPEARKRTRCMASAGRVVGSGLEEEERFIGIIVVNVQIAIQDRETLTIDGGHLHSTGHILILR